MPDPVAIAIFSLTNNGQILAERLQILLPDAEHYHKPSNFQRTAQQVFNAGKQCLFICATGIVIRTLAPVLQDKYSDPGVIVIDDLGQYVIPLLSSHEGGAGVLAESIAKHLGAHNVITSANRYDQPIYCIGIGSDRGCPQSKIQELLAQAFELLETPTPISAIASIDIKRDEVGMLAFAASHQHRLDTYGPDILGQVEDQLSVKSDIVFREVGCYGVAEAAALIAAREITGLPAELVVNKLKNDRATLAIARSYKQKKPA